VNLGGAASALHHRRQIAEHTNSRSHTRCRSSFAALDRRPCSQFARFLRSSRSAWLRPGTACLSAWIEQRSGKQRSPSPRASRRPARAQSVRARAQEVHPLIFNIPRRCSSRRPLVIEPRLQVPSPVLPRCAVIAAPRGAAVSRSICQSHAAPSSTGRNPKAADEGDPVRQGRAAIRRGLIEERSLEGGPEAPPTLWTRRTSSHDGNPPILACAPRRGVQARGGGRP
jgi:hypothetical protein